MAKDEASEAETKTAASVAVPATGEPEPPPRDGWSKPEALAILKDVRARRPPVNVDVTALVRDLRDEGH